MNIKKKLNNYVQNSLSEFENEEFLDKLKSNSNKSGAKYLNGKTIAWTSACAVVLVVLCLTVFLWKPWQIGHNLHLKPTAEPTKNYSETVEVEGKIDYDQIDFKAGPIFVQNDSLIGVDKVVDSGDDEFLFYKLTYESEETGESLNIYYCSNMQYELFSLKNFTAEKTIELNGFTLCYSEHFEDIGDGLYYVESKGEIILDDVRIYIEYDGVAEDEISNFLNFLNSTIE